MLLTFPYEINTFNLSLKLRVAAFKIEKKLIEKYFHQLIKDFLKWFNGPKIKINYLIILLTTPATSRIDFTPHSWQLWLRLIFFVFFLSPPEFYFLFFLFLRHKFLICKLTVISPASAFCNIHKQALMQATEIAAAGLSFKWKMTW